MLRYSRSHSSSDHGLQSDGVPRTPQSLVGSIEIRSALQRSPKPHARTVPCLERRVTLFFAMREQSTPPPLWAEARGPYAVCETGEESHQSLYLAGLLLDSRVVDVPRVYHWTFVILSSLKPLFFNSLKKAFHFSDNAGAEDPGIQ